MLTLADL